jgi:uncharacterized protein (TIGR00299 family) protein
MKIAYFDCFAGVSGDMLLGALVDAGASLEQLNNKLAGLELEGFELVSRAVQRAGLRAVKVDVVVADTISERQLGDILAIVEDSHLPDHIITHAAALFKRLGQIEAKIHGVEPEQVHLHELGGLDTIVDVIGTLLSINILGIQEIYCSAIHLGSGQTKSQHGALPLPSPATLALLEGVPVAGRDIDAELVTPTGAALLTSLAKSYGPIPSMRLQNIGYGAGSRELDIPNVLRLLIGEKESPLSGKPETLVMLETNIDDWNPEFYDYLFEQLYDQRAVDVTLIPIQMKKNRPATQVQVLCEPKDADRLANVLFLETSSLGIRRQYIERYALKREVIQVNTPYGAIRVKVARLEDSGYKLAPEYEDCRRAANKHQIPIREVYRLAAEQAHASKDSTSKDEP